MGTRHTDDGGCDGIGAAFGAEESFSVGVYVGPCRLYVLVGEGNGPGGCSAAGFIPLGVCYGGCGEDFDGGVDEEGLWGLSVSWLASKVFGETEEVLVLHSHSFSYGRRHILW